MENFKQIVFRMSDSALMIINVDETIETKIRFVSNLVDIQKLAFQKLGNYCTSKVDPPKFDYVVFHVDMDRLDIQCTDGKPFSIVKSTMPNEDKKMLDTVLIICTELINSVNNI